MRKWIWLGIGVAAGLAMLVVFRFFSPYQLRGAVIENPQPAPDISLMDANGSRFQISQQRGQLVYLFFGYTNCPDVCPMTLSEMKQLRARLGAQAGQVRFVFVTVDPERDTPERLRAYLSAFDPQFIGLTGSLEELQPVWQAYDVGREIQDKEHSVDHEDQGGYLVSHSSRTYVIDRRGRLRVSYAFGTPPEDIESDLRYLLKEE